MSSNILNRANFPKISFLWYTYYFSWFLTIGGRVLAIHCLYAAIGGFLGFWLFSGTQLTIATIIAYVSFLNALEIVLAVLVSLWKPH